MSDAWAILAAGLGGSAVTGAIALLLGERQAAHGRQDRVRSERARAYADMLATSGLLAHRAEAMHQLMRMRSGLTEGLDIATRVRKPLDALEIYQGMLGELASFHSAWARVWTVGSPDAVRLANIVVDTGNQVISAATARGEGRTGMARWAQGEKWTEEQLDHWRRETRAFALARRDLALLARKEAGVAVAEVFLNPPADDASDVPPPSI